MNLSEFFNRIETPVRFQCGKVWSGSGWGHMIFFGQRAVFLHLVRHCDQDVVDETADPAVDAFEMNVAVCSSAIPGTEISKPTRIWG